MHNCGDTPHIWLFSLSWRRTVVRVMIIRNSKCIMRNCGDSPSMALNRRGDPLWPPRSGGDSGDAAILRFDGWSFLNYVVRRYMFVWQ